MRLPNRPLRSVKDSEIVAFETDGVVCLRGIFPQDWIDFMAEAVDGAMALPGPHSEEYEAENGGGRFFGDLDIWKRHDPFRRFVFGSPAAEVAGTVMKSRKINFFYDQLLVKEPGTSARTPWHQDQPYWAVSGRQVASIWLPFDPVATETSVEYVAGSHRWEAYSPYHFADGTEYEGTGLPPLPDIEAARETHDILSFACEPGDCLVFQAMIVHGAPPNNSPQRRRALASRWCGDDARYSVRPGEVAIPTSDPGLKHGDALDSDDFPVVWEKVS